MDITGVRLAMKESLDLAEANGMANCFYETPNISFDHFIDMYTRSLEPDFSLGKANRWLGWIQGVMCALELATLEEVKEINKRYAS